MSTTPTRSKQQCQHEADWETVVADGYDGCMVTVRCRHCGEAASVTLELSDFRWEDTFRRLDEDLATPPGPDPEREDEEEEDLPVH